jgi:cytidylate kinase
VSHHPGLIAIDGPAASGKSSLGRALAKKLDYFFLDTGLMYRAFTLAALERGIGPGDEAGCADLARRLDMLVEANEDTRIIVDGEDVTGRLRSPEVEAAVSAYSAIHAVRNEMVRRQRALAARGRMVMAGRDIGTVVLPEAPLKIYLEASEAQRVARRQAQAQGWGERQGSTRAHEHIAGRDHVDSSRPVSPLRPADDAVVIDTSAMSLEEVLGVALRLVGCEKG